MLETIIFGSYFFGSEPEALLFMLYTILLIWSSALRSTPKNPVFAPHLLDIMEATAATDFYATEKKICEASSEVERTCTAPQMVTSVTEKYCGRSVGQIAINCGIALATSVYFDPRRFQWINDQNKRILHKKIKHAGSYILGRWVNFVMDMENWWAKQSFFYGSKDSGEATEPPAEISSIRQEQQL